MLKNVMQQCSSTINYYVPPFMRILKKNYSILKCADDRGVCGAYFFIIIYLFYYYILNWQFLTISLIILSLSSYGDMVGSFYNYKFLFHIKTSKKISFLSLLSCYILPFNFICSLSFDWQLINTKSYVTI